MSARVPGPVHQYHISWEQKCGTKREVALAVNLRFKNDIVECGGNPPQSTNQRKRKRNKKKHNQAENTSNKK